MTDLLTIIWLALGLLNVFIIGHEYAAEMRRDSGLAFLKCTAGVLLAPFYFVFTLGYKIKKFPKFKVSIQKDNS